MESEKFLLQQEIPAHSRAVRCACYLPDASLVSGGLDSTIAVWRLSSEEGSSSCTYNLHKRIEPNRGGVYALCASQATDEGACFYAGFQDSGLLKLAIDGDIRMNFLGHSGPVASVCESSDKQEVASGSWDGTAIVWNAHTGSAKHILRGHSHSVCVSFVNQLKGFLITGSQDGNIRFWQDGQKSFEIAGAHTDIVRGLAVLDDMLVSVSNDASLKSWSVAGDKLQTIEDAHDAFIFDIKLIEDSTASNHLIAATASDDGCVKIWNLSNFSVKQILRHPDTLWQLTSAGQGTFATCCEDGKLRVWTQYASKALLAEAQQALEEAVKEKLESKAQKMREQTVDVSKLPPASTLLGTVGEKQGQIKLVQENGIGYTYEWRDGQWVKLGELVAPPRGQVYYEGDTVFPAGEYDYVYFVEIGDSQERKKLPFSNHQNPQVVAENFCARESISKSSVLDIMKFIEKNSQCLTYSSSPAKVTSPSSTIHFKKFFPLLTIIKFDKSNWDAVFKRIQEINSRLSSVANTTEESEQHSEVQKLTETEMSTLKAAIGKLEDKEFLKQEFKGSELKVMFERLSTWDEEFSLPVVDIWRAMALHRDYSSINKGSDGWRLVSIALKHLANPNSSTPVLVCTLRFLANLFYYRVNRHPLIVHSTVVLGHLGSLIASGNAKIRLPLATVLTNFSVALNEQPDAGAKFQVYLLLKELLDAEKEDTEVFFRVQIALGTLISEDSTLLVLAREDAELRDCLVARCNTPALRTHKTEELISCTYALLSLP